VIAASAEGYSFPTNLDSDAPVAGMAPPTQNELVHECLASGVSVEEFNKQMRAHYNRRLSVPG